MMLATHNVEEAVLMCDRILLFSSNPGRVSHELTVPFPHPRNRMMRRSDNSSMRSTP